MKSATHQDKIYAAQEKLRQIAKDLLQLQPAQVDAVMSEVDSLLDLTSGWRYADLVELAEIYQGTGDDDTDTSRVGTSFTMAFDLT